MFAFNNLFSMEMLLTMQQSIMYPYYMSLMVLNENDNE